MAKRRTKTARRRRNSGTFKAIVKATGKADAKAEAKAMVEAPAKAEGKAHAKAHAKAASKGIVSDWTELVKKTYESMKIKNPSVKLGQAMKEASKLRKTMSNKVKSFLK